jgi:phage shock protein PspC (stress-responsive transcriptional regulator)
METNDAVSKGSKLISQSEEIKAQQIIRERQRRSEMVRDILSGLWQFYIGVLTLVLSFLLPFSISFQQNNHNSLDSQILIATYISFAIDLVFNTKSALTIMSLKNHKATKSELVLEYATTKEFWVDLMVTIPFSSFTQPNNKGIHYLFHLVPVIKIARIQRYLHVMDRTQEFKQMMRLVRLLFYLILYIHLSTCLHFYIVNLDQVWMPSASIPDQPDFYQLPVYDQYILSAYTAIMMFVGDEITPVTRLQIVTSGVVTLTGSFVLAYIFGTVTVVF